MRDAVKWWVAWTWVALVVGFCAFVIAYCVISSATAKGLLIGAGLLVFCVISFWAVQVVTEPR